MSANPVRIKVVVLAAIAWVTILFFVLPNLGHGSAAEQGVVAFAAAWNLLGLWFIRRAEEIA
jgi:hypothetical protein